MLVVNQPRSIRNKVLVLTYRVLNPYDGFPAHTIHEHFINQHSIHQHSIPNQAEDTGY